MNDPVKINLKINGKDTSFVVAPQTSLLRALRDAYYWEVKCGCEEGDCGTCMVLLDNVSVKSCVTLAAACDGHEVWTNKGLGYETDLTAKLQKNFVECGAIQCGFCTPGMIVAGTYYLKKRWQTRSPGHQKSDFRKLMSLYGISENYRCNL